MQNAHIIGLGKSGNAAARLLKSQGWQVTVSDSNTSPKLHQQQEELIKEGINVNLGKNFNPETSPHLVVVSPGVPWDIPPLEIARHRGIEIVGEMELAWRNLNAVPWVGITGTNGKTTTTALIAAIFKAAGLNAPACGNIGNAACELALEQQEIRALKIGKSVDWVIAEVSSYQIESSSTLAPKIGVWTTFTPDHLNRHHTLENYYNIKAKLLKNSEIQVINGDDPYLRQNADQEWKNACWTSVQGKSKLIGNPDLGVYIENDYIIQNQQKIIPLKTLKMVGKHNLQNLLMAVATARLAGIEPPAIEQAISNFPGVPHRLEAVGSWQDINWINDSKATNYDAAQVGLAAVEAPVILIAGGEAKAGDDTQWLQTIQEKAAAVLLIGDAAEQFSQRLKQVNYQTVEIVETMEKAIPKAAELASHFSAKVVLLSPACASFDQYESFEHRGDHFRQLCLELIS
ncbi:UDP-N-acetylmuramoyl-L-alanine--D-glutamate ligase [Lyngbya sp. PCC 8106]|uniref:UDP-N-acetylmuramoyl-L-alanine--D-glutamate ligase n=1 Tax=Lyngbya sp. (strain PCC 8106) TaxID=313612 RepID=UPI0000EAB6B8|nr:UDP-N-acetylmuramoyl-L-alanine--D-glutamate ligase [Lyngbya sp. PCC 8106]EAW36604.1 UDP-N-acetylmuramoyl-L-alanyl-D-glutamate synthetase [Lyngbya sp. PCC 8106]